MRIGIISDTHGYLDPAVAEHFAGVDHILHAGDLGTMDVLYELRTLAPVTAVLGNVDYAQMGLRLTEMIELAGQRFLLHHIVNPHQIGDPLRASLAQYRPHVVVYGHTHIAAQQQTRGAIFFNPGYAGQPRFNQPRSLALAHVDAAGLRFETLPL